MNTSVDRAARERQYEDDLADLILGYLAEHPRAMDTLEGIAGGWVMRQKVRVLGGRVARVLDRLTTEGVLEQVGGGGDGRYRLRRGPAGQPASPGGGA